MSLRLLYPDSERSSVSPATVASPHLVGMYRAFLEPQEQVSHGTRQSHPGRREGWPLEAPVQLACLPLSFGARIFLYRSY